MPPPASRLLAVFLAAAVGCSRPAPVVPDGPAGIALVGVATIPGTASDLSGLTGKLEEGTPQNRLGGLGSGIAYTGAGTNYLMLSDRGPADGAASYPCRMHALAITADPASPTPVTAELTGTTLFADPAGKPFSGALAALGRDKDAGRFDPEGIRVGRGGSVFVSEEYGPGVIEFDRAGRFVRALPVPDGYKIANPGKSKEAEMPPANTSGRFPNRGLEGLAISPDGGTLFAVLQSPLIQDGASAGGKGGVNVRLLALDVATGSSRQFVYPLDHPSFGISEIVAVNGHEFLVLERDGLAGRDAKVKTVVHANLTGATDVSGVAALPARGLPAGVVPMTKRPFLDLLAPKFGLAGPGFPEKFEGLAFGPDLPDGRRLLLVTVDNDFVPDKPTRVLAFAVDRAELPGFEPQQFDPAK